MTHVTCRLTAKNRDQLWNPTLGNRVWATFTFIATRQRRALKVTPQVATQGAESAVYGCLLRAVAVCWSQLARETTTGVAMDDDGRASVNSDDDTASLSSMSSSSSTSLRLSPDATPLLDVSAHESPSAPVLARITR